MAHTVSIDDYLALWALDTHASRYGDVPMPKRGTYRLSRTEDGRIHAEAQWTDGAGAGHSVAFDMRPDGASHPLPDGSALRCFLHDDGALVSEVWRDGAVVHLAVRRLSDDRETMDITQTLTSPAGEVRFDAVYRRLVEDVKQVILYRRDLQMRKGKIAAQVAHASLAALLRDAEGPWDALTLRLDRAMASWVRYRFAKVVLSVESEDDLVRAYTVARERGLPAALITDSGKTEFHGVPTRTTAAIGPASAADIDAITGPDGLVATKLA